MVQQKSRGRRDLVEEAVAAANAGATAGRKCGPDSQQTGCCLNDYTIDFEVSLRAPFKGELRPKTDPPFSVHEHIEAFLVSKNIPLCLNRFPLPEPGGGQNWLSLCFHLKLSSHPVQKR